MLILQGDAEISSSLRVTSKFFFLLVTRNDDEISASPRNIGIYMTLFEQNCNNLKMAAIGRNM